MESVTHLEKVITGEAPAVTHLERVITEEAAAVTYTEKVIAGEAPPVTHLQKVIAGVASPVTHLEHVWAGRTPKPAEHEYTGAVPVTFTANGQPLLDYLISGNTVQNGTPTPDNLIMPQGCGESTGDLFDKTADYTVGATTYNYTISGLDPNKYYTCSTNFERISGVDTASIYFNGGNSANNGVWRNTPRTFKPDSNGEIIVYIRYSASAGAPPIIDDVMAGTIWIMVNEGSTPIPYGYKIPISNGQQTTNIYLGSTQTVRAIKKKVFDGTEEWQNNFGESLFGTAISDIVIVGYQSLSTHYVYNPIQSGLNAGLANGEYALQVQSTFTAAYFKDTRFTTVADFKAFLAAQYANGTPVTVWYVLAEPTTGVVNEPLMRIGNYADTLSMEQAGVQIPTNNGSTTVDVDTELKPSEVYIKYMG